MAQAPALLAGLRTKGAITAGHDADFTVLAPEETFTVVPSELHHRNQVTAYAGRTLHGVVRSTWLRGERIADRGTVAPPAGRLITPAEGSNS
jgi:allantoinase